MLSTAQLLLQVQLSGFALGFGGGFIQLIGDFPYRRFLITLAQQLDLSGRPGGFSSSADVQLAKFPLHRDERSLQLRRQHHCILGRILLFQKRNFLLRVRSLFVWSLCDFSALPIKVFNIGSAPTRRGLIPHYKLSTYLPQKRLNPRMWSLGLIYHQPCRPATKKFHENKIKNRFSVQRRAFKN